MSECSIHYKYIARWHDIEADTFEAEIPSICEIFWGKFTVPRKYETWADNLPL